MHKIIYLTHKSIPLIHWSVAQFFFTFPHKNVEHVNDPTERTFRSSLQQVLDHISQNGRRVCNFEHNENSFCVIVLMYVLELFTATNWFECKLSHKTVHRPQHCISSSGHTFNTELC